MIISNWEYFECICLPTSKCHCIAGEIDDIVWSSVVDEPPVALVRAVKLECGVVGELDDLVEGSFTRERKLRNVDIGDEEEEEFVEIDEDKECDECEGKPIRTWWLCLVVLFRLRIFLNASAAGDASGNE